MGIEVQGWGLRVKGFRVEGGATTPTTGLLTKVVDTAARAASYETQVRSLVLRAWV